MERIKALLEPGSCLSVAWTFFLGLISQLDLKPLSAFLVFVGLIFHVIVLKRKAKINFYKEAMAKNQYEKICGKLKEGRAD